MAPVEVFLSVLLGLTALALGAFFFIRGASRIAVRFSLPPMLLGLTVIAFGSAFPKLFIALDTIARGHSELALGTVLGSNIFNVLFILGVCASILPLVVSSEVIRRDVPIFIGSSALGFLLAHDGQLSPEDGWILVGAFVAYNVWLIRESRKDVRIVKKEFAQEFSSTPAEVRSWGRNLIQVGFGLAVMALGAHYFINDSLNIARNGNVPERLVGLTFVAAGTSLLQLGISVIASFRGDRDVVVGSIIGSNIFNALFVLGISALMSPGGISVSAEFRTLDFPMMLVVAITCYPVFVSGKLITRLDGLGFLVCYAGYLIYLIMNAKSDEIVGLEDLGRQLLLAFTLFIGFSSMVGARLAERRTEVRD
jgi:cation:H+ antiporter